ncbi:MAG: histidine kinase [Vicinamibacterales bacterium]
MIARSSEGVWNDYGAVAPFEVEPMFYQTRWFAALCIAVAIGALLAVWQLRLRQVRQQFSLVLTGASAQAREIHDTLLQSLAGLELQVSAVSTQLDTSHPRVKQQLDRVRRQIQFDVSEARQSIWDLRSPALEQRELAATLEEMGRTVTRTGEVEFEFVLHGRPARAGARWRSTSCAWHAGRQQRRPPRPSARGPARAALHGAGRHASRRRRRLRVRPRGRGVRDGRPLGVAAMHERAQAIGGHLTLVSQPGSGTDLEMVAPHARTHVTDPDRPYPRPVRR